MQNETEATDNVVVISADNHIPQLPEECPIDDLNEKVKTTDRMGRKIVFIPNKQEVVKYSKRMKGVPVRHRTLKRMRPNTICCAKGKAYSQCCRPMLRELDLEPKSLRNGPCSCGSKLKFKKCCLPKQQEEMEALIAKL